jgi:chromosome segregation ATPase
LLLDQVRFKFITFLLEFASLSLALSGTGLGVLEAEALSREASYEATIRDLSTRFKDAEARAAEGERQTGKLQKECDKLEADLVQEQEKYKAICDELERAFNELSGY